MQPLVYALRSPQRPDREIIALSLSAKLPELLVNNGRARDSSGAIRFQPWQTEFQETQRFAEHPLHYWVLQLGGHDLRCLIRYDVQRCASIARKIQKRPRTHTAHAPVELVTIGHIINPVLLL
jgi:hypothetical protein